MKTSADPRHQKRIAIVKDLFAHSFYNQKYVNPETTTVVKELVRIDKEIRVSAPEWPLEKVGKVDLAILRLAVFELLFHQETPPKVIIDEAVEVAKEFGGDSSSSFVNGVLGTIIKKLNLMAYGSF